MNKEKQLKLKQIREQFLQRFLYAFKMGDIKEGLPYKKAMQIKGIPGLTCEIGVDRGANQQRIIQGCIDNDDKRYHICIDPYGDIPYFVGEELRHYDYHNLLKRTCLAHLYRWAYEKDADLYLYVMEDIEFFKRFADGVPIYDGQAKMLINDYALVFLAGPHNLEAVMAECEFFVDRIPKGGFIIVDNYDMFGLDPVKNYLLSSGFVEDEHGDPDNGMGEEYRISFVKV